MASVQVIKRCEGKTPEKQNIEGNSQFSYNSDGHLVIRLRHYGSDDTLFVLDRYSSNELIKFVKHSIRYPVDIGPINKPDDSEDLPF